MRLASGDTLLLVRVEDRRGISHLTAARSRDGVTDWRIDSQPTFAASPDEYPEELWVSKTRASSFLTALGATR